jgi:transposase
MVESILRSTPEVVGEVLPGVSKRREFSTEEKLRNLAQGTAPGLSPSLTCRMHGISSGQFYTRRKQFRSGTLTGFTPVSMATDVAALPAPIDTPPAPLLAGHVEVELPNGVILTDLKSWMTEQRRRLSSKTGLAKALQYALTRWDALAPFAGAFAENPTGFCK